MSTYSVYNIKVDNSLSFTPGPTAGYVLGIAADGSTFWTTGGFGATGPAGANGATGATGPAPTDTKTFQTLADAATISWVYSSGYNAKVTIGANRALEITGATNGDYGTLIITQGSTGSFRVNTWPVTSKWPSGTYSFSTTGTQSDIFSFVYDGTNFYWNSNRNFS